MEGGFVTWTAGGPSRIAESLGTLENVRFEGGGILADGELLPVPQAGLRILEDLERGTGLFRLRFNGKRAEFTVSAQPASGERLEQARPDLASLGVPENALRQFWEIVNKPPPWPMPHGGRSTTQRRKETEMRDAIFERRVLELAEATARDLLASAGPGGRSAVTAAEATLAAIRQAQDFPSEAQATTSDSPPACDGNCAAGSTGLPPAIAAARQPRNPKPCFPSNTFLKKRNQ